MIEALKAKHDKYMHFISGFWTLLIAVAFGGFFAVVNADSLVAKRWGVEAAADFFLLYGVEVAVAAISLVVAVLAKVYGGLEQMESDMARIARDGPAD